MSDSSEFNIEAQELIDGYSQQLLAIEAQLRDLGESDPDLLNSAFRALHTLKGLAGMFGYKELEEFGHELESSLDAMRLGKLALDQRALDLLFESVELCESLLANINAGDHSPIATDPFLVRLAKLGDAPADAGGDPLAWLDNSIISVLTEYEEHRLRENIRLGRRVFRVHVSFDLLEINTGIDKLKLQLKHHGEVITYLPSADVSSEDRIDLDVLVGSKSTLAELAASIEEDGVGVEVLGTQERLVTRKSAAKPSSPPPAQAAPAAAAPKATPAKATPAKATPAKATPAAAAPKAAPSPAPAPPAAAPAPSPPPAPAPPAAAPRTAEHPSEPSEHSDTTGRQTVRVDLRKLDLLMNLVSELALVHANLDGVIVRQAQADRDNEFIRDFQDQLRVMSRRLGLLQHGILEVRMVPLSGLCDTLARAVRKTARELDKDVRFSISGAETELDKLIVEGLLNPLMHMVRNAIDHGIEMPAERVALGKPRTGRIALDAYQKGNRVVIELSDDGAGMDWRRLRDKAIERGFLSRHESHEISPAQAVNLIFTPGFSTRDAVSDLSGRGVGMDVVKTDIAKLSGMVDIASEPGRGSRFRIVLPITLAVIQALVIETAGQTFCVPLNSVIESLMVQREDIQTIEGHEVVWVRGRTLPLIHLAQVFELEHGQRRRASDRLYVVIVGLAQHRVGLVVDELLGQQDVVIKPIGKVLRQVPGIAGATELGNNRTVLLIDVATLVGESVGGVDALAGMG